ncbi:hypothetical protein N7509_013729 [Penicillium cosmopolitanum]|uniref:Uncharacterized protein n=1 Tax=Penicillium cosmopolitanum TaxID=1131564 RepID=A0A9W9SIG1_9EURO|nr:uncharacterized protein N7509_013729 [Penicillium cosmopolitanum]KAJ5376843.1 hypothetical protein N7509_013729 [Penicillium cosmopolitanum]
MSRRLSEIVTSGIRALSISSCCDGESAQNQSQTQAPANHPKPTAAKPATQQGAGEGDGRRSVGSSRRASFQTAVSQLSEYESAASKIEQAETKPQAGSAAVPGYKYGKLQRDGEQRRRWIEDPNDTSCTIQSSQLTMDDLQTQYTPGEANYENVPPTLRDQVVELGLPDEFNNRPEQSVYRSWFIDEDDMKWDGVMWDIMIVLVDIERTPDSNAPQMSEITLALLKHLFDVDYLRYIFDNGLFWAISQSDVYLDDSETWEHGTPKYDALLGTRIGKLISYIVLGGFERGSFRIARVVTWSSWLLGARANMRFDIEPVDGSS